MKRFFKSKLVLSLVALIMIAAAITIPLSGSIGRSHAAPPSTAGVVTGFPIPTANSGAEYITSGPDGNLWFTEPSDNKIVRITS